MLVHKVLQRSTLMVHSNIHIFTDIHSYHILVLNYMQLSINALATAWVYCSAPYFTSIWRWPLPSIFQQAHRQFQSDPGWHHSTKVYTTDCNRNGRGSYQSFWLRISKCPVCCFCSRILQRRLFTGSVVVMHSICIPKCTQTAVRKPKRALPVRYMQNRNAIRGAENVVVLPHVCLM